MRSARKRESFFTYLSSPKQDDLNDLQRAVYNGRTAKARHLIADDQHNIYQHCDALDMSLLYLAIACDRIALAEDLLTIYEQDYRAIERFHTVNDFAADDYAWVRRPILVACGAAHVALARRLCADVAVTNAQLSNERHRTGLIVLCKHSNADADATVIWCTVRSAEDVPKIGRIIGALYADGCLSFHSEGAWRNVQFLAAARNYRQLYMRIVNAWGRRLTKPETYLQELLQLSSYCADGPIEYFKELLSELGADNFNFIDDDDGYLTNRRDVLIEPLTILEQFDMFEWMMRTLAERRQRAQGGSMQENLTHLIEHLEDGGDLIADCILYDRHAEAVKTVSLCKPDLLRRSTESECSALLLTLISGTKSNAVVMQWIVDKYEEMRDTDPKLLRDIVIALVERDWTEGLRTIYAKYPETVKQYFLADELREDCGRLLNNIDQSLYGTVEFLLSEHREQFHTAELVGDFIWYCASANRAAGVLKVCLQLPGAALANDSKGHGLWAALRFRQRSHYRRILTTVDAELLRSYRQADTGDSLLHVAVWYHIDVVDEGPWEFAPDPQIALEIVDSDDDETTADRKRQQNVKLCTHAPISGPVFPAEYYAQEKAEYGMIFQELIDAGCDAHASNAAGETLIHLAVKYDNHSVLDRLLELGVDPLRADNTRTVPLHLCKTRSMLQRLLQCDGVREQITGTDAAGRTVLHRYVQDSAKTATDTEAAAFVEALLEAGVDVHGKDIEAGDTALHLAVKNDIGNVVGALLAGGADVNARNLTNETPLHRMCNSGELIRLAGDQIDWLAITNTGVSILPALIGLDADETGRLAPILEKKMVVLRKLIADQSTSLDHYEQPALWGLSRNLPWTQWFVNGLGVDVDVNVALRVKFETGDAAERMLAKWLIERGVNFAYLASEIHHSRFDLPNASGWNMLFELGAAVRLDAAGRANALRNERFREDRTKEAVVAIAHLLAAGADVLPLCEDNWWHENVWIFGCLTEWYKKEKKL